MGYRSAMLVAAAVAAVSLQAATVGAQETPPPPPPPRPAPAPRPPTPAPAPRAPMAISIQGVTSMNRAVIGATLGAAAAGDSAGVLVERVTEGGPAAKAGIVSGDRIVAVNGQDIRLTRAESADPAQHGLASRRLRRAIGELDSGDELRLRVRGTGGERNVTLNVVSASELTQATARTMPAMDRTASVWGSDRPAIGLSTQATGTPRDTLGVFVASVVADGPAERAGIHEGDRIVSVGGTDLRVRPVDMSDRYVAQLKATALTNAIRESTIGEPLEIRVWRAGQVRTVMVTPEASSAVRGSALFEGVMPYSNFESIRAFPGFRVDSAGSGFTIFRGSMNDVELQGRLEALREQLEEVRSRATEVRIRTGDVQRSAVEARLQAQEAVRQAREAGIRARLEAGAVQREAREAQDRLRQELLRRELVERALGRLV